MTPEEHELVARMFAKQFRYFELLITVLQSREILQSGDLAAFLALVKSDNERSAAALLAVKGDYQQAAKDIGLTLTFP